MAEQADARDLKSRDGNIVRVRPPSPAPKRGVDFVPPLFVGDGWEKPYREAVRARGAKRPSALGAFDPKSPAPHSHPNFDRVGVGFFFLIFYEFPIFPKLSEQIK